MTNPEKFTIADKDKFYLLVIPTNLDRYIAQPNYKKRITFLENFHRDFDNIIESYAGKTSVYVFIDDLDRCEIPKAADLLQALNLMIPEKTRLFFILGMDREKVAAGLAVKFEKLLPYLKKDADGKGLAKQESGLHFGYDFIEKFVQLSFRLPVPDSNQILSFLQRRTQDMQPEPETVLEEKKIPSELPPITGKALKHRNRVLDAVTKWSDPFFDKVSPVGGIDHEIRRQYGLTETSPGSNSESELPLSKEQERGR